MRETMCFQNGTPVKSFDNGHDSCRLVDETEGGESFDLLVETGTTTLWGTLGVDEFTLETAELYAERPAVADLHRHMSICNDLREQYDEDSPNRGRLLDALVAASHTFAFDADLATEYRESAALRSRNWKPSRPTSLRISPSTRRTNASSGGPEPDCVNCLFVPSNNVYIESD